MAAKISKLKHTGMDAYIFSCPGCEMEHMLPVEYTPEYARKCTEARYRDGLPDWKPITWTFNGSLESPTFQPSLLVRYDYNQGKSTKVCHLFVRDGKLQFLPDCTHRLAGQTVPMTDVD